MSHLFLNPISRMPGRGRKRGVPKPFCTLFDAHSQPTSSVLFPSALQASSTSLSVFLTLVEFLFPFILSGMGFCWLVGLVLFSLCASCDTVKSWNSSENFKASFYLVLT